LREVCDNVLADATIARDKAQLRAVALQMLGEAYMNVKKDTPSSNPIVNGSVPEESEYVRIDTKGSRAREGRSWIVPWCDSCQGYLSARTRGIRPLLDPTIFTSLHYHSRKLFEHQSNLILWPLFCTDRQQYTQVLWWRTCVCREKHPMYHREGCWKSCHRNLSRYHGYHVACITIESYLLSLSLVHFCACQDGFTDRLSSDFMKCRDRNWNITTSWLS